jgi:hypothetical protein
MMYSVKAHYSFGALHRSGNVEAESRTDACRAFAALLVERGDAPAFVEYKLTITAFEAHAAPSRLNPR